MSVQPWTPTWSTAVHQGSQGFAVLPVLVKVGDGQVGDLVLDPSQQPLLGRLLLGIIVPFVLPHGHGDGIVENQCPHQAQDELQVPVHDGFAVWGERHETGHSSGLHKCQHALCKQAHEALICLRSVLEYLRVKGGNARICFKILEDGNR